jgi:hypothetical protein
LQFFCNARFNHLTASFRENFPPRAAREDLTGEARKIPAAAGPAAIFQPAKRLKNGENRRVNPRFLILKNPGMDFSEL